MLNLSHEPPAFSIAPNQDLKESDVLCSFKIKTESQHLEHWFIIDHWPYLNKDEDAETKSGTSSILQSPNQD